VLGCFVCLLRGGDGRHGLLHLVCIELLLLDLSRVHA